MIHIPIITLFRGIKHGMYSDIRITRAIAETAVVHSASEGLPGRMLTDTFQRPS
jgi:hypothetical protein